MTPGELDLSIRRWNVVGVFLVFLLGMGIGAALMGAIMQAWALTHCHWGG